MNNETHEIYRRAGWGKELQFGSRPAILVVDFTNGFTDTAFSLGADMSEEIAATNSLIEAARSADVDIPVIFTTIEYQATLCDAGIWPKKCPQLGELTAGSDAVEIDQRIGIEKSDVLIVKKGASAFFGTNLVSVLSTARVDTVILCGASTSGCIRATAVDLMQYGYIGVVPRECVGDRSRSQHESNLYDIHAKYADVVSVQAARRYVMRLSASTSNMIN